MARPAQPHPTPAELEVLQFLWHSSASSVRDVMQHLNRDGRNRAYTTVMSLLNVMADKRLVTRKPQGRAFLYSAKTPREKTLRRMTADLLGRVYSGSVSALVTHLLDQGSPGPDELQAVRQAIADYEKREGKNL
jgi:BlaI family transcriptional regulator, penicillinase repressor